VKRQISETITAGSWPPGTVLPSEIVLAQNIGVAVGTVRRALIELAREGMVSRRRKTGTVVIGKTPNYSLRSYFQYFRLQDSERGTVESVPETLSAVVADASEAEAEALRLAPASPVIRMHRVRYVDGAPVMHDRIAMIAAAFPDFPTEIREVPALIYPHLLERYGVRVTIVKEKLVAPLADPDDLRLLGLDEPAAVLAIEEVSYEQGGRPVVYVQPAATTERLFYVNEIR
jgi:GntR family transcriptional regulator